MSDSKKQEAAQRAAVEAHCAATATHAGGSYIKHADGSMSLDPNGVTTRPAQPAAPVGATPAAAAVAVTEALDPSAQVSNKKPR